MTVAMPELDGADRPDPVSRAAAAEARAPAENCRRTEAERAAGACGDCMRPQPERVAMLAARVAKLVALRRSAVAKSAKVGVTPVQFPAQQRARPGRRRSSPCSNRSTTPWER